MPTLSERIGSGPGDSGWLGQLAALPAPEAPPAGGPDWLAVLGGPEPFREALPFGEPAPAPPEAPAPDPRARAAKLAYARGEAAGRAAAEAEAADSAARQRALRLTFRSLDEAALGVLAEDLAATVMTLAEGVLGEAAVDRGGLLARCQAAARRIGGAAGSLALHLHPADIDIIGADALAGWRVVPDPAIVRGGLRIEGPDGAVGDGPEEWRRAIAAAVRG
ncbi:FliH/SctL family protein [Erythrobacter sp. NE805]|uniref:FliH/SctL family protein n=1 Tax=Erythrobacter sp. NE805 TaxID=3389875 RepID=UPI00396AF531